MRPENSPTGRRRSFIEQARRAQIIAAAAETVAAVGYANASLAQIAERAGVSKSVISYHFDGKNELMEQVAGQFFEDAWAFMEQRLQSETSAVGKIRAWITAQLDFFGSHRTGFLAMAEIVSNHRAADGSRPFEQAEEEEIEGLAEILATGQRDGEFRDFEPRTNAVIIAQCIEGVLGRWALDESMDLPAQTQALAEFIHHAIRVQDASDEIRE